MVRHLYTLIKLAEELQSIIGKKIVECFSQDRDTLMIALYDGIDLSYLCFSADSRNACLYLRGNFSRAKRNTVDLFPDLYGRSISAVTSSPSDRIMTVEAGEFSILFYLFGASKSNMLVINKNNEIVDALRKSSNVRNSVLSFPEPQSENNKLFCDTKSIVNGYPHLGKYYTEEFLSKDDNIELSNEALLQKAEEFRNRILKSQKCYILEKCGEPLLSLIPLSGCETVEEFDSVSKGIEKRIRLVLSDNAHHKAQTRIMNRLSSLSKRLNKSIAEIEDDEKNRERIGRYRMYADLLMTYPNQKEKVSEKFIMSDWSGNSVEIPLDSAKTINENSRLYFEKARNSELKIKIRNEMLSSLIERKDKIDTLIELTKKADTLRKLNQIEKDNAEFFGDETQNAGASKFRVFDLGEGFMLYVGKNAANNDELTVRFAKPNDLWLHARGTSGSHAVLRLNKDEKPPKHILKKAAGVAAYYSGAKNAKYVPVCYTLKKYVSKPRGANPGSVVLSREDVIMVEPGLPE
jgi:predicted ribosome quality control (RQC) complex YloA/Tae2 family protein